MRPLRTLALLLALAACHHESPTQPELTARVTGTVVYTENGGPVAGARISIIMYVVKGDDHHTETVTDAQGRYSMDVFPGSYALSLTGPAGSGGEYRSGVHFRPGLNMLDFQISANGCATLTGRLRDQVTGGTVAGATMIFLGQTVLSGADGGFRFELGCPPHSGPATMTVDHPAYQHRDIPLIVPAYTTSFDVWVVPK